ncbi:MAG: FlgD immunoglobulin-like domain containing protein, partial [bacterium]
MWKNNNVTDGASKVLVSLCLVILAGSLLFAGGISHVLAGEAFGKQLLTGTKIGNKAIKEKLALAKFNQEFIERVGAKVEDYRTHEVFQQKILEYPAGEKMRVFLQALKSAEANGAKTKDLLKSFMLQNNLPAEGAFTGGITGTVTINGQPSMGDVEVVAFDTFGFFAGSAFTDFSGNYFIGGLAAGAYYVVTQSSYVDEIYNDKPLDHFENWRIADPVNVPEGGTKAGVNFDLLRGAIITGKIYNADATLPIGNSFVNFEISTAANPEVIFTPSIFTGTDGGYEINIPATGNFKIKAEVPGFEGEYYNNKPDWVSANPIPIATLNDSISNIDFTLEELMAPTIPGGVIEGTVVSSTSDTVNLAFIFAFNLADTSIAGFAISGVNLLDPSSSMPGQYQVLGLQTGTYVLFANFYLDFLMPFSLQGEYYKDAATPDLANHLPITAVTDTLTDIDFTLEPGGAIAGNITDNTGVALDSVVVVAIDSMICDAIKCFFHGGAFCTEYLDFGLGFSDVNGNYTIGGLSDGNYVLRTFSWFSPHTGQVLDEYYDNVQSIFAFDQATPVPVTAPDTTKNIDFELDRAGAISGYFFETDGSTPIDGHGVAFAFNEATGFPELAIAMSDTLDGSYVLSPLPTGSFYLLGLAFSEDVIYLPQFYDGAASLATATAVPVTAPGITTNINFKMVRAGAIQGIVNLPSGNPVGADSLDATLVGAFDATTGELMGGTETTFAGGYRIVGLPPGNYKVGALPIADGFAGTYHGGGTSFDDVNSLAVPLAPDDTARADIDLNSGNGTISGMVYNADGSMPVNGVLVLAYDPTGHVVSAGVSGFNWDTELPLQPGEYEIPGLVSGGYFVRTFSLFQLFTLLENLDIGGDMSNSIVPMFSVLSAGNDLLGSELLQPPNIELFGDVWYPDVVVPIDLADLDLFSLLFGLILSEGDPQFIIPFFDLPPSGAQLVTVTSPGERTGINFFLPKLADILVEVSETPANETVPKDFQLSQNYPNPFNPSTVINYGVPRTARVQLNVYNLLGQRIRTLFDGRKTAGTYTMGWDGLNDQGELVAAGIYFVRLETDNQSVTRKMLLIR